MQLSSATHRRRGTWNSQVETSSITIKPQLSLLKSSNECFFFFSPGNRVYSTHVQHKNISQIMKTSLLKISTKTDPIGTRLSVPPKTRQKYLAYKTCQRWPVSIPLTSETAHCFVCWEKEVWLLYLNFRCHVNRFTTLPFKVYSLLTATQEDTYLSVGKSGINISWLCRSILLGISFCNSAKEFWNPWRMTDVIQKHLPAQKLELQGNFLQTRHWQQSSNVSFKKKNKKPCLMFYHWVCN